MWRSHVLLEVFLFPSTSTVGRHELGVPPSCQSISVRTNNEYKRNLLAILSWSDTFFEPETQHSTNSTPIDQPQDIVSHFYLACSVNTHNVYFSKWWNVLSLTKWKFRMLQTIFVSSFISNRWNLPTTTSHTVTKFLTTP